MASTDARPLPRKNVANRITFPIFDADGDLVTGATGLDSEVSIDGGAFADCTSEATEIGSSGMYYLDLTAAEMNGDTVAVIVKTSSSGAKTTPIVMYPEEAGDVRVDVVQISGDSTAADNCESFFDGTGYAGTANVIPTVTTVTNLTNAPTAGDLTATMKTSVTTAASAATPAVTVSDKTGFSLSTAGILAIWHQLTSAIATAGSIGKLIVDYLDAAISTRTKPADTQAAVTLVSTLTTYTGNTPQTGDSYARLGAPAGASHAADIAAVKTETASLQADTNDIQTRLPAALVGGRMDSSVGAMAADTLTASALAADAVAEMQSGLATAAALPTANQNADALLDRTDGVETGITLRQAQRVGLAAAAGKLSGAATTTVVIKNPADSKSRITATVDADGNRSAVTLDLT